MAGGTPESLVALKRSVEGTNAGPLDDPKAALLVWFLRYGLAVDELDSYEHVFDDPGSVDGWYIDEALDSDSPGALLIFEVKASFDRPTRLTPAAVEAMADEFEARWADPAGLFTPLGAEAKIASQRNDLDRRIAEGELRPILVVVTTATVSDATRELGDRRNVEIHGHAELTSIARALDRAGLLEETVLVEATSDQRFVTTTAAGRIAVCEVSGQAIAEWPGIDDRSLFGLNVRHELGTGPVRTELDSALSREQDQAKFLAFHNGLTVICDSIRERRSGDLAITGLSVVNGAQSVIALRRNVAHLTSELKILVKFVEAGGDRSLAGEIARRSNTQNAVNPRNLRALDGRQQLLEQEFDDYQEFEYIVRPDVRGSDTAVEIKNDDAAQWLCALYLGRPWLAVKRTELFRSPTYQLIFDRKVSAERVILAWKVRQAVQRIRAAVPVPYRRSWRLVAIVGMYLIGEIMRDEGAQLDQPKRTLGRANLEAELDERAEFVAKALDRYHLSAERHGFDDFKVAFKNQAFVRDLAVDVLAAWRRREE